MLLCQSDQGASPANPISLLSYFSAPDQKNIHTTETCKAGVPTPCVPTLVLSSGLDDCLILMGATHGNALGLGRVWCSGAREPCSSVMDPVWKGWFWNSGVRGWNLGPQTCQHVRDVCVFGVCDCVYWGQPLIKGVTKSKSS